MKKILKLFLALCGVYLFVLLGYGLFAFFSMSNPTLAFYERKLNPSTFAFWQGEELYAVPPFFTKEMTDKDNQLSAVEPEALSDIDIWVLLLDGPEDIRNASFASQLGVDVERIAASEPGLLRTAQGAGISFRMHPIPFYVSRRSVVMVDIKRFSENFRAECRDELVYELMINLRDEDLWSGCSLS